MDLQALRHCPEFEPRSNKGPVGLKIHSLSLGKIHLECKIVHNCLLLVGGDVIYMSSDWHTCCLYEFMRVCARWDERRLAVLCCSGP